MSPFDSSRSKIGRPARDRARQCTCQFKQVTIICVRFVVVRRLVGRAVNSVTLRALLKGQTQAKLRRHSRAMSSRFNTGMPLEKGALRVAPQRLLAALSSLELATASPALARLAIRRCDATESHRIYRTAH